MVWGGHWTKFGDEELNEEKIKSYIEFLKKWLICCVGCMFILFIILKVDLLFIWKYAI